MAVDVNLDSWTDAVGLSRDKPVGFLVAGIVLTAVVALAFLAKRPHRTVRGDEFLERLKARNAALQATASRDPSALKGADLTLAVALAPNNPTIRHELGYTRNALGDYAGALKDLDAELALKPDSLGGFDERYMSHFNLAHFDAAYQDADRVARGRPPWR